MANNEHLATLEQGVKAWNAWRTGNPQEAPDLSGADLPKRRFSGFNLSNTNFHRARLFAWEVDDCDFARSDLTNIDAQASYWRNAQLRGTRISGDLVNSTMYNADLSGALVQQCGLPLAELRFLRIIGTEFAPYLHRTHINSWTITL